MSSISPQSDETPATGENASPNLDRAWEAVKLGQPDVAIFEYTRFIEEQPTNPAGYLGRGVAYRHKGELAKALLDYNQAIEIEPSSAGYCNRGNIYGQLGRHEEALADFNQAIALKDKDDKWPSWTAYKSRAECFYQTSRFEEALADYLEVIRLNPERDDVYHGAAKIWATCPDPKIRNGKLAVQYAAKANELCTTLKRSWNPEYMETLIAAFIENKNFGSAINLAETILKKDGLDSNTQKNASALFLLALRHRAYTSMELHDYEVAIADLTQIIRMVPEDADAYMARGIAYNHQGNVVRAFADFSKMKTLVPEALHQKYGLDII
jgi:tetratricopeptide (TPR) repeat protein